jgi:two-component system nitrogen regulation sensor histidine kinase NtrY
MVRWPFGARRSAAEAAPTGEAPGRERNEGAAGAASKSSIAPKPARRVMFWVGLVCAAASILWSVGTYLILTGLVPITISLKEDVVAVILMLNVIPILATAGITAWHGAELWWARRRQAAGSGLHVRIVALFGVVAVLPAVFVALMASVALDRGLNVVFAERTSAIVQNSQSVAIAYVNELVANVRTDSVNLAKELETSAALIKEDRNGFISLFRAEAALRNLRQAYLIDSAGRVILAAQGDRIKGYRPPPGEAFKPADMGKMVSIEPTVSGGHRGGPPLTVTGAAALKKLNNFENTYLYVVRPVRPEVIRHIINTMINTAAYDTLKENRWQVQLATSIMYVAVALALLLGATWLGMWFANRLVEPIQDLIGAAKEVSQGDLAQLGASFNKMTSELRSQRDELVETNATLNERRRFIEAVLSGVTAGVIGVDASGVITLANRSAVEMLGVKQDKLIGARLEEAAPEFGQLLNKSSKHGRKPAQAQIALLRHGSERSYAVRITREREGKGRQDYGLVVTFDDISELVVAQRTSAWADVARRLAHEIKNPLTPIQLSAERIRRKYGSAISKDRDVFDRCTDTIIRHVGDIGRMVDEFSAFARMPKPDFEAHNLAEVMREAVILFQMSHPEIKYVIDAPKEPAVAMCDRRLITQAVTNLVKNAGEAVTSAMQSGGRGPGYKGRITARLRALEGRFTIEVMDNGVGLPKENRHRLVEPYVTTRQKGTGLGLAIVQRITEQHGGFLELEDAPLENGDSSGAAPDKGAGANGRPGALVRLTLPANRASDSAPRVVKINAGVDSETALNAVQG